MKIIQLSEAEASNSTVMAQVAKHLLDGSVTTITGEDVRAREVLNDGFVKNSRQTASIIPAEDRPDAGFPPEPPKVASVEPPTKIDPTAIGFGATVPAQQEMVLPFPGATVPVAANLVSAPAVAAAPSPSVGGAEVDKHGLPWDARIHSSGENRKNADGSWRKKRGVDDVTTAAVEAELRQIMAVPALAVAPVAAPPIPAPPVAAAVPQVPLPPAAEAVTFDAWMKELTPAMAKQYVTTELFTTLITRCYPDQAGANLSALVMRPELIPPVRAAMAVHLDGAHPGWRELQA